MNKISDFYVGALKKLHDKFGLILKKFWKTYMEIVEWNFEKNWQNSETDFKRDLKGVQKGEKEKI